MSTGLDHAFILHFDKLICVICCMILCWILYKSLYMVDCIRNTKVRKHNLRGSEKKKTKHDSSGIELNCISVWNLAPLTKKG